MLNNKKIHYLLVGGFNTLAGYLIGIGIYKVLNSDFGIVWVGIIANIISITVSFLTYKLLVFKTKGKWISEYAKSYIVYGVVAIIGIFLLWFFMEKIIISIWLAQALIMVITIAISYIAHSKFTFQSRSITQDEFK